MIELLVVISIIALLIAVLLPALSRSREVSQQIACASQVRGLNASAMAYSVDNNDTYPYQFGIGAVQYPLSPGTTDPSWIGLIQEYVSSQMKNFTCPTLEQLHQVSTGISTPDALNRFSYDANGVVMHFGQLKNYKRTHIVTIHDDVLIGNHSILRPFWTTTTLLKKPSMTAPGWVGWSRASNAAPPTWLDAPHGGGRTYKGRSAGGQNYAFLDGSAQFIVFQGDLMTETDPGITSLDFGLLIYGEDKIEPPTNSYSDPTRWGTMAIN